jgi:hypothetical protein
MNGRQTLSAETEESTTCLEDERGEEGVDNPHDRRPLAHRVVTYAGLSHRFTVLLAILDAGYRNQQAICGQVSPNPKPLPSPRSRLGHNAQRLSPLLPPSSSLAGGGITREKNVSPSVTEAKVCV